LYHARGFAVLAWFPFRLLTYRAASMLRFFTILLLITGAHAASAKSVTLTLADAPSFALRNNLSLAAARLRIEEARGRLEQSGRLSNPELSSEWMQNVRSAERSVELALTQRFPLTARLRLEKAVSRAELVAAEEEVREEERKVIALVRANIVRLLALEGQRELRASQLANSRELAELTRTRVEAAEASLTQASLLDLETRQLETELLQLAVERATLLGELRPQLGIAPADEIQLQGSLPGVTAGPGASVNLASRPDFRSAQATAEAARLGSALARAGKWEDFSVGLALQSEYAEDAPEGFERDDFVGLRFSLPLPLWNANSGRIHEADAAAVRRSREVDALSLTIQNEAAAARSEMDALAKVVSTIEGALLPQAKLIEEQLRSSHATAQTALSEVLLARDRRLLIERQRLDALRDFHLARVRLDAATGRGLSRATSAPTRSFK
jgi:cobalt-zinc-cadmium efflux system outer membrane protein